MRTEIHSIEKILLRQDLLSGTVGTFILKLTEAPYNACRSSKAANGRCSICYAFSSENCYSSLLTWSLNKKKYLPDEFPKRNLSFLSTYDVMSPSDKFLPTD